MIKKWSNSILSLLIFISLTVYDWISFQFICSSSFFTCYLTIQKKNELSKSWAINLNVSCCPPKDPSQNEDAFGLILVMLIYKEILRIIAILNICTAWTLLLKMYKVRTQKLWDYFLMLVSKDAISNNINTTSKCENDNGEHEIFFKISYHICYSITHFLFDFLRWPYMKRRTISKLFSYSTCWSKYLK